MKSRYFDPVTARFISVDTPENAAMSILRGYLVSGNLYVYCGNAPVNASDPSGYYSAAKEASWLITALFPSIYALKVSGAALIAKVTAMIVAVAPYLVPIAAAVAVIVISTYSQQLAEINRAHTKIQRNVRKNAKKQYWVAYRSGDYVVLREAISYQEALSRVKSGKSVFTTTKGKAYALAYAAGNNRKPVGEENHGKNMPGYYWHYHPYGHGKAHIWFLFF